MRGYAAETPDAQGAANRGNSVEIRFVSSHHPPFTIFDEKCFCGFPNKEEATRYTKYKKKNGYRRKAVTI